VRVAAIALLFASVVILAGCRSPGPDDRPRYHTVSRGETLWRISQNYGTSVQALARANRIPDQTKIRTGMRLYIPPSVPRGTAPTPDRYAASHPRGRSGSVRLAWPVKGQLTSRYGLRGSSHHDGIDIAARRGTPIQAADAGRVVHSDNSLAGYGHMVIVKHAGSYSTVYAHNRKNLVRVGDFVDKGQVIAEVGSSGRTSAPHLHFEVRQDGKPRNPLKYLP